MKIHLTILTFLLISSQAIGQWDPLLSDQRTGNNPIISKASPFLLLENDPSTGIFGGLGWGFNDAGGQGDIELDGLFFYNRDESEWTFSNFGIAPVIIDKNTLSPSSYGAGGLRIGNTTAGSYLGFDEDAIQAWSSSSSGSPSTLSLNDYGGDVKIGSGSGYIHYDEDLEALGIGTTSPDRELDVDGSMRIKDSLAIGLQDPAFDLDVDGSGNFMGELTAASDRRLKKNIQPIVEASATLKSLNPVSYVFRSDEFPLMGLSTGRRYGLIAQEIEEVFPELVAHKMKGQTPDGKETTFKSVNYIDLIAVLIKSNHELAQDLNLLETTETSAIQRYEELARRLAYIKDIKQMVPFSNIQTK